MPTSTALQVLLLLPSPLDTLPFTWLIQPLRLLLTPHYIVQPITISTLLKERAWRDNCVLLIVPDGRGLMRQGQGWGWKVEEEMEGWVRSGGAYFSVGWGMGLLEEEEAGGTGNNNASNGNKTDLSISWKSSNISHPDIIMPLTPNSLHYPLKPLTSASVPLASFNGKVLAGSTTLDAGRSIVLSTGFADSLRAISSQRDVLEVWLLDVLVRLGLKPPGVPARLSTGVTLVQGTTIGSNKEGVVGSGTDVGGDARWPGVDPKLLKPSKPLPQILLIKRNRQSSMESTKTPSTDSSHIENSIFGAGALRDRHEVNSDGSVDIVDINDTIRLASVPDITTSGAGGVSDLIARHRDQSQTDRESNIKTILVPDVSVQGCQKDWTPLFDLEGYWSALDAERRRVGMKVEDKGNIGEESVSKLGDVVLYGEAVTSTQTMLDKNPFILHNLPTPFISLASFQLSGRGRGSNQWLSPAGCLQFSILLSLPGSFPPAKLVFVQYLMALACCEGLDDDGKLGVRIKWPNDIYAEAEGIGADPVRTDDQADEVGRPRRRKGLAKLGGILVNTSFQKGEWRLVIGCGINILNDLPTTSIAQLMDLQDTREERLQRRKASMEECFAKIVVAFDGLWERFLSARGFEPFLDEYLGRWLHSEQEVTLTTVEPNIPLRIESITLDEGLLRCVKLDHRNGLDFGRLNLSSKPEYVDLQPDGNSFDLMAGLIRKKT